MHYGLSIGAQIITEVLSPRENIAEYALIESALVFPVKGTTALTKKSAQRLYD